MKNALGKCVSGKSKGNKDEKDEEEREEDSSASSKACKAERASIGVGAFAKKYGTNRNVKNAVGKCVSGKANEKDD